MAQTNLLGTLMGWADSWHGADTWQAREEEEKVLWLRAAPFIGLHLVLPAVVWIGWSWFAVGVATGLYLIRMLAITGFYHRYFSHRSFRTGRICQFLFAVLGSSAAQRGPLWWASHHRHHHAMSDQVGDHHSPGLRGLIWSHAGWIVSAKCRYPDFDRVQDWLRYPELRFLDRFDKFVPALLALVLYGLGDYFESAYPGLQTNGLQLVMWGFVISTLCLWHATFTINSLAHCWGKRRFPTRDDSRNNLLLALLTLGEGWHNNHHYYAGSCRQGFYWWEADVTYLVLRLLSCCGLVADLRPVPARVYEVARSQL